VPVMPRIVRAVPRGSITGRNRQGCRSSATLRWHGRDTTVPAIATAWTRDAVEISWDAPGIMAFVVEADAPGSRSSGGNREPKPLLPGRSHGFPSLKLAVGETHRLPSTCFEHFPRDDRQRLQKRPALPGRGPPLRPDC
jgi:hypothetical protein